MTRKVAVITEVAVRRGSTVGGNTDQFSFLGN